MRGNDTNASNDCAVCLVRILSTMPTYPDINIILATCLRCIATEYSWVTLGINVAIPTYPCADIVE